MPEACEVTLEVMQAMTHDLRQQTLNLQEERERLVSARRELGKLQWELPRREKKTNTQVRGEQCDVSQCGLLDVYWCSSVCQLFRELSAIGISHSFIHSIGICRMRQFLAFLRSFFLSSLLCTFSCHSSPSAILSSSLTSSCHLFLGLPLFSPNSYIIPFWEFYFLPFSVRAQTNVIYLTLLHAEIILNTTLPMQHNLKSISVHSQCKWLNKNFAITMINLQAEWPETGVWLPGGWTRGFSSLHSIHTDCGALPVSYAVLWGTKLTTATSPYMMDNYWPSQKAK